jgi:hypothetical protein
MGGKTCPKCQQLLGFLGKCVNPECPGKRKTTRHPLVKRNKYQKKDKK